MKELKMELDLPSDGGLSRVIEPLASFICAADQPTAALVSALTVLFSEVEQINLAAFAHFDDVVERR